LYVALVACIIKKEGMALKGVFGSQ